MHWIDPDHLPETAGVVDCFLLNGGGEADGLLLTDGRSGRFPPQAGVALATLLQPNAPVLMRGTGLVTPHGTVILAREIGSSADDLRPVAPARPGGNPHRPDARTGNSPGTHPF